MRKFLLAIVAFMIVRPFRYVRAAVVSKAYGRRIAALSVGIAAPILVGGAANATTGTGTDLSGGAGTTFFTAITSYFTGNIVPAALILLATTVGVSMLWSWGKRAAKSR